MKEVERLKKAVNEIRKAVSAFIQATLELSDEQFKSFPEAIRMCEWMHDAVSMCKYGQRQLEGRLEWIMEQESLEKENKEWKVDETHNP